ncbi:hypothetical protein [Cardiobacterium sp. Marseille-Q4385]|jgi:hypothetical protein|uniref:hypothetical protein n=1 Tax=Cardiobacterium sp. Marseille-Q4385 TaxID=2866573 RepID=UPI001CE4305E|nr:hypothetical protein [Cardiobacterium sp. Marseille-Q4385]
METLNPLYTKNDAINFNRIVDTIHESIIFIKDLDFMTPFDRNILNKFLEIIYINNHDISFSFDNLELESLRKELLKYIEEFNYLINYYTYPTNNSTFSSVYTGYESGHDDYEQAEKTAYKIIDSVKKIHEKYQSFYKKRMDILKNYPDLM